MVLSRNRKTRVHFPKNVKKLDGDIHFWYRNNRTRTFWSFFPWVRLNWIWILGFVKSQRYDKRRHCKPLVITPLNTLEGPSRLLNIKEGQLPLKRSIWTEHNSYKKLEKTLPDVFDLHWYTVVYGRHNEYLEVAREMFTHFSSWSPRRTFLVLPDEVVRTGLQYYFDSSNPCAYPSTPVILVR